MQDQNNHQESKISQLVYFSLQQSNSHIPMDPQKFLLRGSDILDNMSMAQNNFVANNNSEQESKYQVQIAVGSQVKQAKKTKNYSKNYRRRHKQYVQSLKAKNQRLQNKIEELTLKIDQMSQQINSLKYGTQIGENVFDSLFVKEKEQVFKDLVNQSQGNNWFKWDKFKRYARTYGFAGRQKINLLNYYMSQIVQNLITDNQKSFVLNVLHDFQGKASYSVSICQRQQQLSGLNSHQFKALKKFIQNMTSDTIKQFHKSGQLFYESFVKLMNNADQIQNKFIQHTVQVTKMIDPEKLMRIMNWYEQNKHCRDMQSLRKQWFESFRLK